MLCKQKSEAGKVLFEYEFLLYSLGLWILLTKLSDFSTKALWMGNQVPNPRSVTVFGLYLLGPFVTNFTVLYGNHICHWHCFYSHKMVIYMWDNGRAWNNCSPETLLVRYIKHKITENGKMNYSIVDLFQKSKFLQFH